jgi:hypothetical protein
MPQSFAAAPTPPASQPAVPYGGGNYRMPAAPQPGGPSEFTRVLGAQRAPGAAPIPGAPSPLPQQPQPDGKPKKSWMPIIIAANVLLVVIVGLVILFVVMKRK